MCHVHYKVWCVVVVVVVDDDDDDSNVAWSATL